MDESQLLAFEPAEGIRPGSVVISSGEPIRIPVGEALFGRTINGLGRPVDGLAPLQGCPHVTLRQAAPKAMTRQSIRQPFVTGQRVIDGLLTLGQGQRIGLFAGGGVGKSTLLGEIAKHAQTDVNVIVLVGERGREVRPFIEECLGSDGLKRSVVIVATSDETPLMKRQAVRASLAIASYFRDQGANVLYMLDSITRLAQAQREIGLACGEHPGTRGYPPSVFALLARTLEQLGQNEHGSITGIVTVLVDGDDVDEPVSDAARAILDGHLVMDRKLAAKGHFPAINVLHSTSRVFNDVTDSAHRLAVRQVRQNMATYEDVRDLIQIGLYQAGINRDADEAIRLMPQIDDFVKQDQGVFSSWAETQQLLESLCQNSEGGR